MTFIHKFSRSVTCRCEVEDTPPEPGTVTVTDREIFWQGQPKKKHLGAYIQWQNEVNRILSAEWGMKLMHCFRIAKNRWQFWCHEPNQPPVLVKVGNEPEMPYSEATHNCVFDADAEE
jgi:hypothetical protein